MYPSSARHLPVKRSLILPLFMAVLATATLHTPVIASSPQPAALAPENARPHAFPDRAFPDRAFQAPAFPKTHFQQSQTTKQPPTFSAAKANLYAGEFSIAGITLSSTIDDVLWMLGSPKSRETFPGAFVDEIFYYGGISVSFAGGQVWDVIATSPKFCTPSGVCPGDPVSYVFDTLGPTDIIGQSAVYTASGMGSCVLDFGISYNAVSQIKLVCQ